MGDEPVRVLKLPRAPGEREARWGHLLCGEVALPAAASGVLISGGAVAGAAWSVDVSAGELAALKAEQARLAAEVVHLKALVQRLCNELGLDPAPPEGLSA